MAKAKASKARQAAQRVRPTAGARDADRRYVELRFSDSHVKAHACRACQASVTGVFVAAVRRGGRGEWLWDAHHVECAARAEPQLARELFERPKPAALARAAEALAEHVTDVTLDPTATCFTRRPLHDVGRLFGLARGGVCGLCGGPIAGVALAGPRVDLGRRTEIPFHHGCVLDTGEVTRDELAERLRTVEEAQQGLADELRRALGVEAPLARASILGADRRSAKREQLSWELWFGRAPARSVVEALVAGEWSWELPTLAKVRPRPDATTAAFRDAVLAHVDPLVAEGLYGASFCDAGDKPLGRARALEAAGRPPYPFPFVGRGKVPRGAWTVRVRFRTGPAPKPADRAFDRWFDGLHEEGDTLSFRARYGVIAPDAPYLAGLREGLDDVLLALHARTPIVLAMLGDGDGAGEGDAWHEDSLRRVEPALLTKLRGVPDARLPALEVERLRREARAAHAHAEEMGDPKAAWEALEGILGAIPVGEEALRAEVRALLADVVAAELAAR